MLLSGEKIKKEVKKGRIIISPFENSLLNPNSYNYRLSSTLYEICDSVIDPKKKTNIKKIVIPENGYVLKPNRLYLGSTIEKIGSPKYVTQLIGRSSVGRLGLFLQVTAPLGHVGCEHCWTLELRVVQPLRVYPNMKIGQVSFWRITGNKKLSYKNGEYNKYIDAEISKFYKDGVYK